MAVIAALSALKRPSRVTLYSDSQYVTNGALWLSKWAKKGWRTSENKPVKNRDLWELIAALMAIHDVTMKWVKGHNGNPENEVCDQLAGKGGKIGQSSNR